MIYHWNLLKNCHFFSENVSEWQKFFRISFILTFLSTNNLHKGFKEGITIQLIESNMHVSKTEDEKLKILLKFRKKNKRMKSYNQLLKCTPYFAY